MCVPAAEVSAKMDHEEDKFVEVMQEVALTLFSDSRTWFAPVLDVGGDPQVDEELCGLQAGSFVNLKITIIVS